MGADGWHVMKRKKMRGKTLLPHGVYDTVADMHTMNVRMPFPLVDKLDQLAAERRERTGYNITRSDVVRELIEKAKLEKPKAVP